MIYEKLRKQDLMGRHTLYEHFVSSYRSDRKYNNYEHRQTFCYNKCTCSHFFSSVASGIDKTKIQE